jgi:hypothetical protein
MLQDVGVGAGAGLGCGSSFFLQDNKTKNGNTIIILVNADVKFTDFILMVLMV